MEMITVVTTTVSVPADATVESLRTALEEGAVPVVEQLDGLRSATWTVSEDRTHGLGVYVFDTEEAARQRAAGYEVGAGGPGGVTIDAVGLYEVLVDVRH